MTERENILKAYRFEKPERIPLKAVVNGACWAHYGNELDDVLAKHPVLFPQYANGVNRDNIRIQPIYQSGEEFTDKWGCVWETSVDGIAGCVIKHPLPDWSGFADYHGPDPAKSNSNRGIDWSEIRREAEQKRDAGELLTAGIEHGFLFLRLTYIRGYENVLFDMYDGNPRLEQLIEMIVSFNEELVRRHLELKPDIFHYPEDLGMQNGPMISPDLFRKYIIPGYDRLMKLSRDAGVIIHMHSDGHIFDLLDDILDLNVNVINLQDVVHGIDNIAARLKGKAAIDLDIDRQSLTRFGTPEEIDAHIRHAVEALGSPEGGLSLIYGLYPGTPPENFDAVFTAMEKYSTYY